MGERAFLSLGSNVDPASNLPRATRALRSLGRIRAVSTVYLNPAVGPTPQPDYLNAAVLLETDLAPQALRDRLRGLEVRLGRRRRLDKYAPRSIDIDLVLFGSITLHVPPLILPHPDLTRRPHVAIPIAELAPEHLHPLTGESLGSIAERLRPRATLRPQAEVGREVLIAAGLAQAGSDV